MVKKKVCRGDQQAGMTVLTPQEKNGGWHFKGLLNPLSSVRGPVLLMTLFFGVSFTH